MEASRNVPDWLGCKGSSVVVRGAVEVRHEIQRLFSAQPARMFKSATNKAECNRTYAALHQFFLMRTKKAWIHVHIYTIRQIATAEVDQK